MTVQLNDHMVMLASRAIGKMAQEHGIQLTENAQIMMAVNAARGVVWAINHPEEVPEFLTIGGIDD